MKPSVFIITGPTAVGKSRLIRQLASKYPIEVINADSRQVYRHLRIGTSKPSLEEQTQVPYHLVDFLEPHEQYSAGQFLRDCYKLLPRIIQNKRIPIIAGGTFFYIKALWDGLLQDVSISNTIHREVHQMEHKELQKQLYYLDPLSCERIHSNNIVRLQRALMVTKETGKPFSSFKRAAGTQGIYQYHPFQIDLSKPELNQNIRQRLISMFQEGWLKEVAHLCEQGLHIKMPAMQTFGYKDILQWMQQNKYSPRDIIHETITTNNPLFQIIETQTRNFAKRQMTWFKNEKRLKKIDHHVVFSKLSRMFSVLF